MKNKLSQKYYWSLIELLLEDEDFLKKSEITDKQQQLLDEIQFLDEAINS